MTTRAAAVGRAERPVTPELDADIALLTGLLDDAILEHDGERLLRLVAQLRQATVDWREPSERTLRRCEALVAELEVADARRVARAFTAHCQLLNVADERDRVRGLRAAGRAEPAALPRDVEITEVLTAHPTEARRRAVLEHLWRIGDLLDLLDDPRSGGRARSAHLRHLAEEITGLWLTDPVRGSAPTPLDEVRATAALFDRTIFTLLPRVVRSTGGRARFRWSTWVGGDRDGNPLVTADVTRQAADIGRDHVLRGYAKAAQRIARSISVSARDVPASGALRRRLAAASAAFPTRAAELRRTLPDAPHRRALVLVGERISATLDGVAGGYRDARALADDLAAVRRSLAAGGAHRLADGDLADLCTQVDAFGFHLASIEIRQHAAVLARAVARHDEEVAATFATIAAIQRDLGRGACHRLVVSFTRGAEDVANAYALARRADARLPHHLDVVPLFESGSELERAAEILDDMLALPPVRRRMASNGNRLEVMLGYSDSAKEMGMLAASLRIWDAQRAIAVWAQRRGVELTMFHGRGGALGRGGGPTARAIRAQPPGTLQGRFKVTEQGEVAFARYGDPDVAWHHLEQIARAVAEAPDLDAPDPSAAYADEVHAMASASEDAWRDLVTTPGFARWFSGVTPIAHIASLPIASRPVSRAATVEDLDALRAIPWVFAWSQARVNLPGWYGLGTGLEAIASQRGGVAALRRMYRAWPFFAVILENAELSLAKADRAVAARYLSRAALPGATAAISDEWRRTEEWLRTITGHQRLLEGRPTLRATVDRRAPAVAALSLLQLRFLDEPGAGVVPTTIGGIAAGLQNTG